VIGDTAGPVSGALSNTITIGSAVTVDASNTSAIGTSSTVTTRLNGATGIYALTVGTDTTNGNGAYLTVGGTWTNVSDRRVKENIRPLEYSLEDLLKIEAVSYELKGSHEKQIGFIAQDLYQVVPEVVTKPADESKNRWGVSYGNLVALVVKSMQELYVKVVALISSDKEQTRKIASLEEENIKLREENNKLKDKNEETQAALCTLNKTFKFCKK